MEYIKVEERSYIFAIQTNLEKHLHRLVELLSMCRTGQEELHRLRLLMQDTFEVLEGRNIRDVTTGKLDTFVKQMPLSLLPLEFKDTGEALISLQLSSKTDFFGEISSALCSGIRHFTVAFMLSDLPSSDVSLALMEGRLRAMQIGNALHSLKKRFLHYLRSAIKFTLVLPALLIGCYAEIRHAIVSSGYIVEGWMLDVRGMQPGKLESSWKTMSQAKQQQDVEWIGLWGCGRQVSELIAKCSVVDRVSVCALDVTTFLDLEGKTLQSISSRGAELMLFNVYGPKQTFLTDQTVQSTAATLSVSPEMLALKWAEHQGARIVMPHVPDSHAEFLQAADASKGQQDGENAKPQGDLSSDDEDVGPTEVQSERVIMHRTFVTNYRNAPEAATCAHAMATALAGMGRLSNVAVAQHLDDATSPAASARPRFGRRHSVSGAEALETQHETDAKKSTKQAEVIRRKRLNTTTGLASPKTQPEPDASKLDKRGSVVRKQSTQGSLADEGLNNRRLLLRRHSTAGGGGSLETRNGPDASKFSRQVSEGISTTGSARRSSFSWRGSGPVPDLIQTNGELYGDANRPYTTGTPRIRRRSTVVIDEPLSPLPVELDRKPRRKSSKSPPPPLELLDSPKTPRCAVKMQRSAKDEAISALRLSSTEHCKCCFCVSRADGELPEMVQQIVERLLKEDMAIEKVAEIIGVKQAVIENIAHKTAEGTPESGDGKTTSPEGEAVIGNITTAANSAPIEDTVSEGSGGENNAHKTAGDTLENGDGNTTAPEGEASMVTVSEASGGETIAHKTAELTLENGDGKTTAPEGTAAKRAPSEDAFSESSGGSFGESVDKSSEVTHPTTECIVGG
jgi:hypothetical protein